MSPGTAFQTNKVFVFILLPLILFSVRFAHLSFAAHAAVAGRT